MKIGNIRTGNIGSTLGRKWAAGEVIILAPGQDHGRHVAFKFLADQ